MKNKIIVLLIFLTCILVPSFSYASTQTEERTLEDLKVNSDIILTDEAIESIMQTPKVDETEKIYDFAELFSEEEEKELLKKVTKFIKKNKMDMVIVTIDENNKQTAQIYADDFYDYNYFGIGTNHDGILFLIDMDTREVYISTTGKAIQVYTDRYIDRMLDSIFKKSPLYNQLWCTEEFIKVANTFANIKTRTGLGVILVLSVFITSIVVSIQCKKHKTVKPKVTGERYLNKESFNLTRKEDRFLITNRSRVRIETSGGGYRRRWRS
ncbi:MAG: TPM domain-containing protein [Clostridia bacterium]|nr:TPM domain-containing protein [Clostridia bacterium]